MRERHNGREDYSAGMAAESLLEGESVGVAAATNKDGERMREAIRGKLQPASKHLADKVTIHVGRV